MARIDNFLATGPPNLKYGSEPENKNKFKSGDETKIESTKVFGSVAATGANASQTLTYGVESGDLPPELTLDYATGELSGKLTKDSVGDFTAVFKVTDEDGNEPYKASSDPEVYPYRVTIQFSIAPLTAADILAGAKTPTGDEEGNPRWFSLSLAMSPEIMALAKVCRQAATLLQQNLAMVKKGAEIAKTLMLLQANAIALILNAIADELEKLYEDLYNAGGYFISINGQEGFNGSGSNVTVSMSKEELTKRYDNATAIGLNLGFDSWLKNSVEPVGTDKDITKLAYPVKVRINTDPFQFSLSRGMLKQQTPNQFMGKLMMKLQDSQDPDTPTFSSSAETAAMIGLVGVPSVPLLDDFRKVLYAITGFLGASTVGAWDTMGKMCDSMFDDPFTAKEHEITLYGVRRYKFVESMGQAKDAHTNHADQFEKGDIIRGEETGIALEVVQTEADDDHPGLGLKPTSYIWDGPTDFDFEVQDQTMLVKAAWGDYYATMPAPIKLFFDTKPGELVTQAGPLLYTARELDKNGNLQVETVDGYKAFDPGKWYGASGAGQKHGVVYAYKTKGGPPNKPNPPRWTKMTLAQDLFPAYGRFLGNILVFANFLRGFAGSITKTIEDIIKFIDDIIIKMEDIVESITALLDFFESLKDIGLYGLIVQDPGGSGLLEGGTAALVDAIGRATGDDATISIDPVTLEADVDEETGLPPGVDPLRIKPPESLVYTAGFCLVIGGPGSGTAWENIMRVIPKSEAEQKAATGIEGREEYQDVAVAGAGAVTTI